MAHAGPNPDHGYTSFDNIGWSLLMALQILTMDYWENLYEKVIECILKSKLYSKTEVYKMFKKWLRALCSPFDLAQFACLFNLVTLLNVLNSVKFSRGFDVFCRI